MKIHDFKRKKQERQKMVMLTCYDYPSARIIADSQIDCILVGDSVAMAVHGYDTTIMATMEMMILHTQAVARGIGSQFLVVDLPFLSHKMSKQQTMVNVGRLFQAGAQAVKIEGADPDTCHTILELVQAGIPVMGHIGLTAQMIHQLGGHKVQGKTAQQAQWLKQQADDLEQAGCFALVIECVPQSLAKSITESLEIPTIGIGAGPDTDGQVLVWHDILGFDPTVNYKFVKKYSQAHSVFLEAINQYTTHVRERQFPTVDQVF